MFDPAHTCRDRKDWLCEPTRELLDAWNYHPTLELGHAIYERLYLVERHREDTQDDTPNS